MLPPGIVRLASFELTKDRYGIDGTVELLQDDRIHFDGSPPDALGGDPCKPVDGGPRPRYCETHRERLQPSVVRLVTGEGRVVGELVTERPFAKLASATIDSTLTVFAVTVDVSAGFGSYSGPSTRFAEVANGKLRWAAAREGATGEPVEIVVMSSLKTAWKLAATGAQNNEIFEVACRPDDESLRSTGPVVFVLRFTRFFRVGDEWRKIVRSERGCWEEGDPFPARSRFP